MEDSLQTDRGAWKTMSKAIEKDLVASIKKNLPAEVGAVLKARLEEVDYLEKALVVEHQTNDALDKAKEILSTKVESLNNKLAKHAALDEREGAITLREQQAELSMSKVQLDAEKRITSALQSALLGLVRNIEYRSSVYKNEPVVVPNGNGFATVQNMSSTNSETKTAE